MGSRNERISSAEATVLVRLAATTNGRWESGERPLWESRYWTLRLLNILAGKGMVTEVVIDETYEITRDGLRRSKSL
jgi:hypothetical protein